MKQTKVQVKPLDLRQAKNNCAIITWEMFMLIFRWSFFESGSEARVLSYILRLILLNVACSVLCEDAKQAVAVKSQLQQLARPMYSNPPVHGALVVSTILGDPELKKLWLKEVKVILFSLGPPLPSPHHFVSFHYSMVVFLNFACAWGMSASDIYLCIKDNDPAME